MHEGVFLGLDIGTSGVKAILVRPTGDVVASATAPLTLSTPRPGWAEQDPDAWWAASIAAIAAVRSQRPNDAVLAVGIS
ncbi:MAG: FGGY family carbohydrate kinase, partial [Gemmatimonadaceae bacterium]